MSLLLGADWVTLLAPATDDPHGWTLPGTTVLWEGSGNLQRAAGQTDIGMGTGGGQGPFNPNWAELGQLFLPPDAPVVDGVIAQVGGTQYVLRQCRPVHDPRGTGDLDCWVAVVNGVSNYQVA
jgi:hypothetical protein